MSGTRVHRLLQLIMLMRSGQILAVEDIASRLGVSRRTVFRDMDLLERSGVPCRFDSQQRGYRIDEWYFLPPTSLTLHEAVGLMAATRVANNQNFPLYAEASRALGKILQSLPSGLRNLAERMSGMVETRWPAMIDVRAIRQAFQRFLEAAASRRKVQVRYDSYYEKQEIGTVLHPYRLALLNRAWYIVGFSEAHRQVRTFNLDRVTACEMLEETFREPENFSLEKHLGDAWMMVPEGRVYHVRLRFLPQVAGNVEEVVWHPKQRTQRRPDGSLQFEVDVDGLAEIVWWIMGYADQVIVERPIELRNRVRQMARSILQHYEK